jgi:sulfite reductase (NADPH) hemoprotein beta-component
MTDDVSRNERIKEASDYLRGTLAEGLRQEITGAIGEDDQQLVKFHGLYLQDDRDLRPERMRKKMEKAFAFMIRVRVPGGVLSSAQWLALDQLARDYADGSMRLTTRQTVELHGVIKSNLKETLNQIDAALLDSIAACGDVNRNVMCGVNPEQSEAHAAALDLARAISAHLTPRTPAYRDDGRDLWAWLERGAHIYVCGDALRMAKDVERALIDVVAEHGKRSAEDAARYVTELKKNDRYQADVY